MTVEFDPKSHVEYRLKIKENVLRVTALLLPNSSIKTIKVTHFSTSFAPFQPDRIVNLTDLTTEFRSSVTLLKQVSTAGN
jgi:hypothetical protein